MCLAVPGRVVSLGVEGDLWRTGRVDFGGVIKEVSLACVEDAGVGSYVLVHAGVAISHIDGEEAHRLLESLRTMAEAEGPEEPPAAAGGGTP